MTVRRTVQFSTSGLLVETAGLKETAKAAHNGGLRDFW